ncbi:MAG: DUF6261 family protein [Tannerellaceae bacterium]|jgi:hypothetical protein|nr:DUF6261 family protein [Tannerellaceae bacterium]
MKAIDTKLSFVGKLHNSEHFEMHEEINQGVAGKEEKLGDVLPRWNSYVAHFHVEDDIYKRAAKSVETKYLHGLDHDRRDVFRMFRKRNDAASVSFDPVEKAAAEKLTEVIENYKNIATGSLVDVSALAFNMIQTLRLPRYAAAVTTLALGPAVNKLEELNEEFKALYVERAENINAATDLGAMKDIRPKTDKGLALVIEGVNALYVSAVLAGNTALAAALEEIIDLINSIIRQYRRIYAHRAGSAGSPDKPDDDTDDDTDIVPSVPSYAIAAQGVTDGSTMYVTLADPDSAAELFAQAVGSTLILLLDPEAEVTRFDIFPITGLELSQESGSTDKPIGLKVGPQENSIFDVPTYNAGPCTAWVEKDDLILAHLTGAFYPGSITND